MCNRRFDPAVSTSLFSDRFRRETLSNERGWTRSRDLLSLVRDNKARSAGKILSKRKDLRARSHESISLSLSTSSSSSSSSLKIAYIVRRYSRKKKEKTASYLLPSYNSWQMATMFVTERVTRRERNSPLLPLSFRFQPILFPPVITFRVSNPQLRVIKIARNIFAIRETG